MNFNVNTKTAGCDLSRHQEGSGSRSEVQFIPTSEPHWLESGASKDGRRSGREVGRRRLEPGHPSATSKLIDHSPKYGRFTKVRLELWPRPPVLEFPTRVAVWGKSSVLNPPAGICSFGQLWLLSGYYSAQQRMAEHGDSSWQSHRRPVPSLPLHISATQKQPRLFIYNLLWKSPHTSLW